MTEAHDGQRRLDGQLEVGRRAESLGEVGSQVDVVLHQAAQTPRPQVFPAHPQLQRPEPARALDRVLVPIEGLFLGDRTTGSTRVIDGRFAGGSSRRWTTSPPMSYAWKNHLCGSTVTESASSKPGTRHASRSDKRAAPPYAASTWSHRPSARATAASPGHVVHRTGVGRPRDGADRERRETGRAILGDRGRHRLGLEPEEVVGGDDAERSLREPQDVEAALHREVGLVARVDAHALEQTARGARSEPRSAARWMSRAMARAIRLAITPPGGEHAPRVRTRHPDQVAEPADDLLLDESARPGRRARRPRPAGSTAQGPRHRST